MQRHFNVSVPDARDDAPRDHREWHVTEIGARHASRPFAAQVAGRVILRRSLRSGQWLALVLLTLGAAVSQIPPGGKQRTDAATATSTDDDGVAFLRGRAVGDGAGNC